MSHDAAQPAAKPRIEVVRATRQHAAAMAEFFRAVWDADATEGSVIAARAHDATINPGAAGQEAPTFLFVSDGRILGYVSSIPTRVWSAGTEHYIHWIKGLMVHPEHRNGPIGFLVLKEAARQIRCAIVLTVNPASRRLFSALGFTDLGALPNHLRILRAGRVLQLVDVGALGLSGLPRFLPRVLRFMQRTRIATIAGAFANVALAGWSLLRGRAAGGLLASTDATPPKAADIDALWAEARSALTAAQTRDGAYIHWRYAGDEREHYRFVSLREANGGRLVGLVVLRTPSQEGDPRLRGVKVATIADILYPRARSGVGLAALAAAERSARRLGADALLNSAPAASMQPLLARRAYVRLPGNVHFFFKDADGTRAFPTDLSEWWLTRGDGESDGVF